MPKLNDLVRIGFCSAYGDSDFNVSAYEIQRLPREKMSELMLGFFHAQRLAWDTWQQAQPEHQTMAASIAGLSDPQGSSLTGESPSDATEGKIAQG